MTTFVLQLNDLGKNLYEAGKKCIQLMGIMMGPKNTDNLYGKTMQEDLWQHLLYVQPFKYVSTHGYVYA
jgi:hypothetical protein